MGSEAVRIDTLLQICLITVYTNEHPSQSALYGWQIREIRTGAAQGNLCACHSWQQRAANQSYPRMVQVSWLQTAAFIDCSSVCSQPPVCFAAWTQPCSSEMLPSSPLLHRVSFQTLPAPCVQLKEVVKSHQQQLITCRETQPGDRQKECSAHSSLGCCYQARNIFPFPRTSPHFKIRPSGQFSPCCSNPIVQGSLMGKGVREGEKGSTCTSWLTSWGLMAYFRICKLNSFACLAQPSEGWHKPWLFQVYL